MSDSARELKPQEGWPAERTVALGSLAVLTVAAAGPIVAKVTETFTDLELNDTITNISYGAAMLGLVGVALNHRISQRRGTARDRNLD